MSMQSVWGATTGQMDFPQLSGDLDVDVAIVGGGITGISAACVLAREGRSVAVLEALRVGEGTTGNSTGNLYWPTDQRLYNIRSKFDLGTVQLVAESRRQAVEFIRERVQEYALDCAFTPCPWVLYSESSEHDDIIEQETEAAQQAGIHVVRDTSLPLPFNVQSAMRIDGQAQFNPLAYVKQLARAIQSPACRIFEHTKLTGFDDNPTVLHTNRGTVRAKKVIMATHTPKGISFLHTLLGPYREYAIAVKLRGGYPPPGIYWSTEQPHHHSLRSYSAGDRQYLVVIGEPHKVGQHEHNDELFGKLEEFVQKRFDVESVVYRWAGQHYRPADGLPYIGESAASPDVYVATGFATDGLAYGTAAAILIKDLINNTPNPLADVYDARRFTPVASATEFVKENVNVIAQYLKDLPGTADEGEFADVAPGEGRTVETDGAKYAVYREDNGALHVVSAVCTHMDCIVDWNRAERSWDCPCHGSRFTVDGEVIEGPAIAPLQQYRKNEEAQ